MKTRIPLALLLIFALALSGCWGSREMDSLAYILVLGIDEGEKGGVAIYAQVGVPSQPSEGGGGEPAFITLTSEGRNMTEAVAKLFIKSTKIPDLSHLQLLIFSEKLASSGLQQVLDFLRRDYSLRENVRVAVAEVDIEDLLNVEEKLSKQPALAIINQFRINTERSTVVQSELKDLVSYILEPDRQGAVPIIGTSEDRFTLGKTAVFNGYKMAATLDMSQTLGLQLWRDHVSTGQVTIPLSSPGEVISLAIIKSTTDIKVSWQDNKLLVRSMVDVNLDVQEMADVEAAELKTRVSHYFVNRMRDTLQVAQKEGVDFLGLSAKLRRKDTESWRRENHRWSEVIQNAEYDLRCVVHIRGQGPIR
jgi:spore germination protein KC